MVIATEWLNANAGRAYPIQEDMGRTPSSSGGSLMGSIRLPNFILVDCTFTVPSFEGVRVYLYQLAYTGTILSMVFRLTDETTLTTITLDTGTHVPNTAYSAVGIGDWSDCRGWVVVGNLSRLADELPQGVYTFLATQTLLEARTVRPALRGVRSLRVTNQGTQSNLLTGNVNLLAGPNIALEYDAALNGIWIKAVPNAGYQEECACDTIATQNIVETMNGIALKDVQIVGDDDCIVVETTGNTIKISDKCSTPCCGCPELEFLNQTIEIINASMSSLENYSQLLNERITLFMTSYALNSGT